MDLLWQKSQKSFLGTFSSTHSVQENHHRVRGLSFSFPQAWTVRAGCPANTTREAWPLSVRIGRSGRTYPYTATLIGCGRDVSFDVNGDWLEVTRCQRAPEKKLERGAGIYLGQSQFSRTVNFECWGYKLRRSARLF